jgi:Protein of unknown function (DUF2752)
MQPHASHHGAAADAPAPTAASGNGTRFAAVAVLLPSVAILAVAYALTPSAEGVGTHVAMGLPACGLLEKTGVPCATCGMTTAFSYAAHGDLLASFVTQPAGAILALVTAMAAALSGYALVFGMSLAPIGAMIWRPRVVIVAAAVLLLAWAYKIVVMTGMMGAGV